MRATFLASFLLLASSISCAPDSSVRVNHFATEHETNPMGIGVTQPRFSWKLISNRPGEVQTAYEIRAASSADALSKPDLWDSGKVKSDQSVLVQWAGKPLGSRAMVYWQVRIWDKAGKDSAWSDPAWFELGILDPASEWKGKWITIDLPRYDMLGGELAQASWITPGASQTQTIGARTVVNLPDDAQIQSASIDVAAEGLIALYVNGKATRQGASSHTAPFYADFGNELKPGKNVIAISSLAVRGARGGGTAIKNAIAAHAVIELASGQHIDVVTDGTWKSSVVDLVGDWSSPDFDDSSWQTATVEGPYSDTPPIRSADGTIGPGRYLRKTFTLKGPVAKARLYATALGVYEASINGKLVTDDQFTPGWTDYFKRVMVQTYDVTKLLAPGQTNTLGALLADGWFAGRLGWMGPQQYAAVADHPSFNAQLEITYADGSTDTIATDDSWKGGGGELVGSDQQLGEVWDARRAVDWQANSFDDSGWKNASVEDHSKIELDPQLGPPVRKLMELTPKKITEVGGTWVVDFGQNMVGHIRLTGAAPAGTQVEVLHGEMLNADGSVYNENLRQAISLDTFIFRGTGSPETFEPKFTFHGFRYAQISGYPGQLTPDEIRGIVVGSDTPDTGTFSCSDPDVNQLFSNIRWGQRGNYLSVPTDCPQRDERQGWMGDAQVFAPTATYNADVAGFFTKWMVDVDDGQLTGGNNDGAFCQTSPRVANNGPGYPIWGDAGVIVPWVMYTSYGDKKFLEANYDHMARWVDYCQSHSTNLLESGGVGDNLAPLAGGTGRGGPGGAPGAGTGRFGAGTQPTTAPGGRRGFGGGGFGAFGGVGTITANLDNCYFAHSAWIVSKAAALLGKTDDAAKYDKLYHDIVAAYDKQYLKPDGTMTPGDQSTYVVALSFGMIPDNLHDAVVRQLTDDVTAKGHLSTGFVGVGFLEPVLTVIGRKDLAYQLLLTDTYPSWLFPVKEGATTIWERWDGWTPEKGFQTSTMNSFNHYSLGAVGKWLYSGAAGIGVDEQSPGFKHFILAPQFSDKFSYLKATFNSPYGEIASGWTLDNGKVSYDATVPPNSSATLTLPATGGDLQISGDPVGKTSVDGTNTLIELPAGTYHFSLPLK